MSYKEKGMRKITLINTAEQAGRLVKGRDSIRFVVLDDVPEANRIRDIFKSKHSSEEIDKRIICEKNFPNLRDEYIRFIARLNMENASLSWWGYFFTSKNPLTSHLFYDISNYLVLTKILSGNPDHLIVVIDRREPIRQMRRDGLLASFVVEDLLRRRTDVTDTIKSTVPGILSALKFLRLILYKSLIFLTGQSMDFRVDPAKRYMVVRTILTERSFLPDSTYKDIYFGGLVDYLEKQDLPVIIAATLSGGYLKLLKKIRGMKRAVTVIPMEHWISLVQMCKILLVSLKNYLMAPRVNGDTSMYGIDMRALIWRSMMADVASTSFFSHLEAYYSMESMSRKVAIKKLLYPMENRPWERMMIEAVRIFRPDCRIVGYQHASIGPKHMNFVIAGDELKATPFPDEVITMGEVTRDILVKRFGLPADKVIAGCALRQWKKVDAPRKKPKRVSNVLVALASNFGEYTETLSFVKRAFKGLTGLKIRIRPHPLISISPFLKDLRNSGLDLEITKATSVEEDLRRSDILLYVSATVSLEALSLGMPVIYLDVDPLLSRDPLFDMHTLKWSAKRPEDIKEVISIIDGMGEAEYAEKQRAASDYVERYLSPVTDDCLKKFV